MIKVDRQDLNQDKLKFSARFENNKVFSFTKNLYQEKPIGQAVQKIEQKQTKIEEILLKNSSLLKQTAKNSLENLEEIVLSKPKTISKPVKPVPVKNYLSM